MSAAIKIPQNISGWYAKIDKSIDYDKSSPIYKSPKSPNNYFVQFNVSNQKTIRIWFYIDGGKIKYTLSRQSLNNNETVTEYQNIEYGNIPNWQISKQQIKLSYISKTQN